MRHATQFNHTSLNEIFALMNLLIDEILLRWLAKSNAKVEANVQIFEVEANLCILA